MPNWCSNTITITGDKDKIKSILEKIREIKDGDTAEVFKTLIGNDPGYKETNWYESNVNRFGTKWDVSVDDCNGVFNDEEIILTPDTAWSPPTAFCVNLAKEYGVKVVMSYSEPGNDFTGTCTINESGEIVEEQDYEYNEGMYILDSDTFWCDRQNDYLTKEDLEGKTMEEYVNENYSYVDECERPELVEILTKVLEDNSGK